MLYRVKYFKICFLASIVCTLASCGKDREPGIVMLDGREVYLSTDRVMHYDDEEAFCLAFTFDFPTMYSCLTNNVGPYEAGVEYSIEGFDDKFIGWWEKATFGEWAKKYGLIPGRIYYCATIKYVAYVPRLEDMDYVPRKPFDNVGYTSVTSDRFFITGGVYRTPYEKFETAFRYIGYDESRHGIYKELPLTNKMIWNFTVTKN